MPFQGTFRSGGTTPFVTPAQAGVHNHRLAWIPALTVALRCAFAGMTAKERAIPSGRKRLQWIAGAARPASSASCSADTRMAGGHGPAVPAS